MRRLLAVTVLTLAALGVAAPASAGGWAVTTLDPLGDEPVAGEPFEVGFTIRQHGQTPVTMPDAAIEVTGVDGSTTRFAATPEGPEGHHVATVEVAVAGPVTWRVDQGAFGLQDLGVLAVGAGPAGSAGPAAGPAGSATSAAPAAAGSSPWTATLFGVAAVLAGLGVLDLGRTWRGRRRPTAPA